MSQGAAAPPPVIMTPDQRLRVFVSSTLQELLPERQAAKAAIRRLHLSPVMFELGARPHPPRDLYRAYLEQSHIFVGIYWQRYGWVAPEEQISGLEDEYRLCGDRPKLIYVKAGDRREERLEELLSRIRSDDTASYKPFGSPAELQELLTDDLALMLTERFEASRRAERAAAALTVQPADPPAESPIGSPSDSSTGPVGPADEEEAEARPRWPRVPGSLIGRESELAEVRALVQDPQVQLISLLGPGGVGKTRLALAVGAEAADTDEAVFVPLGGVSDAALVIPTIADLLDVPEVGGEPRLTTLRRALVERTELVVLDNLEQVIGAADDLAELIDGCPRLTLLITSRAPLRVSAEREYPLAALPAPSERASWAEVQQSPAVSLFVERAREVRASFDLDEDNGPAVAELVRRLDGLPLAIELAAARSELLSPDGLLRRLDRRFDLLEGGDRDLPSRQQTLRGTIDWSFDLLGPVEQRVLVELGVFAGGWTMEAAEAVCDPEGTADFLDRLGTLVDNHLVVSAEQASGIRFDQPESIRAYALDKLQTNGAAEAVRERHAGYHVQLARTARSQLDGRRQRHWLNTLEVEHDNLRAALRYLTTDGDPEQAADLAVALTYFWWIRGHYLEGRRWLAAVLDHLPTDSPRRGTVLSRSGLLAWVQADYAASAAAFEQALPLIRGTGVESDLASVLGNLGIVRLEQGDPDAAEPLLEEALAIARRTAKGSSVAPALVNLSLVRTRRGDLPAARTMLEEAIRISRAADDNWRLAAARISLGDVLLGQGDVAAARAAYEQGLQLAQDLQDSDGIAYAVEGLAGVALAEDDADRAVILWGGTDALRESSGSPRPPNTGTVTYEADVARARTVLGPDVFAQRWETGRTTSLPDVLALARRETGPSSDRPGSRP